MDQATNISGDKPAPAPLSLVKLSELLFIQNPEMTFAELAELGCPVTPPSERWRPLSGGREYNYHVSGPVSVDGVMSLLIVEVTRSSDRQEHDWINGFELRSPAAGDGDWIAEMRAVLARNFEFKPTTEARVETYTRGGSACLLIAGSTTEPARLLLQTRPEFRRSS